MGSLTPYMGLSTWDQLIDNYDYRQLANDFQIIAQHDHTPGRGVPIPAGGLAPSAVLPINLDSSVPTIPTGGIIMWTTNIAPPGFLACDGTAYQQSVYPALYAVIGSIYNVSPPIGFFNVPSIVTVPAYGQITWMIKT